MVESFEFRAVCKSVWFESVPVIAPQTGVTPVLLAVTQSNPVGAVEEALKSSPSTLVMVPIVFGDAQYASVFVAPVPVTGLVSFAWYVEDP